LRYVVAFSIEKIRDRLQSMEIAEIHDSRFRESAVLIPIVEQTDSDGYKKLSFVLTVRSKKLKKHSGEISFPGGKLEKNEQPIETALRETKEEIGVDPSLIEIIGRFEPVITMTGFIINPVVGILKSRSFKPNPDEVQRLLIVPFDFFTSTKDIKEHPYYVGEHYLPFLSFDYREFEIVEGIEKATQFTIWGATAHMIGRFFDAIFDIRLYSEQYHRPNHAEMLKLFDQFSDKLERKVKSTIVGNNDN
jgi:8-oxo-dGTP pyrophosphatase MutT (NUDIX family)